MEPYQNRLLSGISTILTGIAILIIGVSGLTFFAEEIPALSAGKGSPEKPAKTHRGATPSRPGVVHKPASTLTVNYFEPSRYLLDRLPGDMEGKTIRYGHALVSQTYQYIGPEVKTVSMRYAGNNLACGSCHLRAGQQAFASPFVGLWGLYPAYEGRENAIGTLEDRVNGCMERSLAGRVLPLDGKEMKAIVMYIKWLSRDVPVDQKISGQGFVPLSPPDRAASVANGKTLYAQRCTSCHGPDGTGRRNGPAGSASGYAYPPVGGQDSFNDGAGMHRLLTAARFIKANMPPGATARQPALSDQEAYDVAAYINSLPRPQLAHKERDYPDLTKKPVDCPYPPYADGLSLQQHRLGPFPPAGKTPPR